MSGKKSKLIRKLTGFNENKNQILRRNYRRVKKGYTKCPEKFKSIALIAIAKKFSKNLKQTQ